MGKETLPGYQRFEFRSGIAGFKWRGMRTRGDPATNDPDQIRIGINVRFRGGNIVSRDGWTRFKGTQAANGCIYGLFDQTADQKRLWVVANGCHGALGGTVYTYNPDQQPDIQTFARYVDSLNKYLPIGSFDGNVYVGDLAKIRKIQIFTVNYGQSNFNIGGINDIVLKDFSLGTGNAPSIINCVVEYPTIGVLAVGVANGSSSTVWLYDGLTWRKDAVFATPPLSMCTWRENLVVAFTSGVWVRTPAGVWTNFTAAGFAAFISTTSMIEWMDKVWIADGATHLWSFDGTTLAVARTPAGVQQMNAVAKFNNLLYYAYNTSASAIVGKYDGTTFIDIEKNLTTQFPNDSACFTMIAYKQTLFVGLAGMLTVSQDFISQIFACEGYNTEGNWIGTGSTGPPGVLTFTGAFLVA